MCYSFLNYTFSGSILWQQRLVFQDTSKHFKVCLWMDGWMKTVDKQIDGEKEWVYHILPGSTPPTI